MTYEHLSVMCILDQAGACFNKLAGDGWEFLDSHVVPYEQRQANIIETTRLPAVIVPHLFSVWRRVKREAAVDVAGQRFGEAEE